MMGVVQESPELYGAIVAFVNAVGLVLVAFNVLLTQTQLVGIGLALNAGVALWLVIRAQVKLGRKSTP
jgi:hypothetical protein